MCECETSNTVPGHRSVNPGSNTPGWGLWPPPSPSSRCRRTQQCLPVLVVPLLLHDHQPAEGALPQGPWRGAHAQQAAGRHPGRPADPQAGRRRRRAPRGPGPRRWDPQTPFGGASVRWYALKSTYGAEWRSEDKPVTSCFKNNSGPTCCDIATGRVCHPDVSWHRSAYQIFKWTTVTF